jgi:hypothetical protein
MLVPRRTVLFALAAAPSVGFDVVLAQQPPIGLRLVRRVGWQDSMDRNRCVIGDLYRSDPGFPAAALGAKVCSVLELAYRNKVNELVPIPRGDYEGFVTADGPRGWRIELKGAADRNGNRPNERSNIQLHIGSRPSDTVGGIVPLSGDAAEANCAVASSKQAMDRLRTAIGGGANRKVVLRVQT